MWAGAGLAAGQHTLTHEYDIDTYTTKKQLKASSGTAKKCAQDAALNSSIQGVASTCTQDDAWL